MSFFSDFIDFFKDGPPYDFEKSYTPSSPSKCIDRARRRMTTGCLTLDQDIPLREFEFGSDDGGSRSLWHKAGRKWVGRVAYGTSFSKQDPVKGYVAVVGAARPEPITLEAVCLRADSRCYTFYRQGEQFWAIVEQKVPWEKNWLKRMFRNKRFWKVYGEGAEIGTIEIQYPVDSKDIFHLNLINGVSLPLAVSSRWNGYDRSYVIPLETPEGLRDSLLELQFLIAVMMRTVYFDMDNGGGGA